MDNVFIDIKNSLLKYCNDIVGRYPEYFPGYEIFDFDSHASVHEWPTADLIGVAEYSITNSDKHYYVTCMIAVATRSDDAQLKRLSKAINAIFSELKPGLSNFPVVDSQFGTLRGNMIVMDDVLAMSVARADTRPVQMIAVHFGSSFITPP